MLLQASGISKSYGANVILNNITLQIQPRERIGLVGVNGAGKSTLLQILAGETGYDAGTIYKAKDVRIGYLAQNSGLHSERTIGEEMRLVFSHLIETERELRRLEQEMADPAVLDDEKRYAAVLARYAELSEWFREQGGYEMEASIRGILHGMGFADVPQETPIATLSGGQRTRLALARLLLQAPDLLLLDEPTNHLDISTLTWLEHYLRGYDGAVVIVSHDRYFLDAVVTSIIEIERTTATRYVGNYSKFVELKAEQAEQQLKLYERQQQEIARMEDFIRRNIARASTTNRAKSRRKALERLERIDRPAGELKRASFRFEAGRPSGKDVLRVEQLAFGYDPDNPLFSGFNLHLRRGESLALIGPNGIGKSSLLKILIGRLKPQCGSVEWGAGVRIGYYDQEQSELTPGNTVLEELWNAYPHLEEERIRTVLGNFLFSGEEVDKKIGALSGGEKARVALAKLMLLEANVLVLDEPTNHLDLFSKEVLESALLEYEGTLLFISHDRYFLNKIADRIVELSEDGAQYFLGNYDDYWSKKLENAEAESARKEQEIAEGRKRGAEGRRNSAGESDYELEKQSRREQRIKQRRLEQLEQQIALLEERIAANERKMADPDISRDYEKLHELQQTIDRDQAELDECYEEWGQLADS